MYHEGKFRMKNWLKGFAEVYTTRFNCKLYYRFSSFIAPLCVGIITSRHYLSEHNKNGEQTSEMGDNKNGGDEKTAEKV